MQKIYDLIERISDSSSNVLITGESGTGKELVAKAIHYNRSAKRRSIHRRQLCSHPGNPS